MGFQALLQRPNGEAWDISELVVSAEVTDRINQAGTCTLKMIDELHPEVGNALVIRHDGTACFAGYVFKTDFSHERTLSVTAHDQLYYLKATDSRRFDNLTLDQIVSELAVAYGLRLGALAATGYPLGSRPFDQKTPLDMIASCIRATVLGTGQLYYIKDSGGFLTLRNIRTVVSGLCLEPGSILTGYQYSRSIDGDTFNQIKLVRDNKDAGKREVYIAKDSETIRQWGLLQYYEKVDDGMNAEQIKEKADALLQLKNRVRQTLSLDALGDQSLRAGAVVCARLPEVGLEKFLLCTCAKHSFGNAAHTVKVDLRMV